MTNQEKVAEILARLYKIWPKPRTELVYHNPMQLLVAAMLSAHASDASVNVVTKRLFARYRDIFDLLMVPLSELQETLKEVNHYQIKSLYLKRMMVQLLDRFDRKVPQTVDELMTLPGVGRKVALVVVSNAFGRQEGIAVDTHVKRLAKMFGLTDYDSPEKVERDLVELVPQDKWTDFHHLLLLYGKYYCPFNKKCQECDLLADLCEGGEI